MSWDLYGSADASCIATGDMYQARQVGVIRVGKPPRLTWAEPFWHQFIQVLLSFCGAIITIHALLPFEAVSKGMQQHPELLLTQEWHTSFWRWSKVRFATTAHQCLQTMTIHLHMFKLPNNDGMMLTNCVASMLKDNYSKAIYSNFRYETTSYYPLTPELPQPTPASSPLLPPPP